MKMDNVVVIDTETTGLSAVNRELHEIAFVPIDESKDSFCAGVYIEGDPDKWDAVAWAMAAGNPGSPRDSQETVRARLVRYLWDTFERPPILAGHNVGFDVKFLEKFLHPWPLEGLVQYRSLDLWSVVQTRYQASCPKSPEEPPQSLKDICGAYGVVNEAPHTALGDATATAEVFRKIFNG